MARRSASAAVPGQERIPVQAVDKPIICKPYEEPKDHWIYDKETGAASRAGVRRPASYWYKTERTGSAQLFDRMGDHGTIGQQDRLEVVALQRADPLPICRFQRLQHRLRPAA